MFRDLGNIVVDIILFCPCCGVQHIDAPDGEETVLEKLARNEQPWTNPPHRSHLCGQCGYTWRPSDVHTNGVASIRSKGVRDSGPVVLPRSEGRPA